MGNKRKGSTYVLHNNNKLSYLLVLQLSFNTPYYREIRVRYKCLINNKLINPCGFFDNRFEFQSN
jgi:hypothetical protein